MFKKFAVVFCALLLILTFTLPVSAAGNTFTEDFSAGDLDNWSNPTIDGVAGVEDAETKDVAKIKKGVMEIENASTNGNFFYIGVKDIKAANFTLTMKVRIDQFNDGWIGVSFRKDFNERYNACNNNMVTLRAQSDNKLVFQGYRGYVGSAVLLNNTITSGYVVEEGDEWFTWKLEVDGNTWKSYINDEQYGEWFYTKNVNEGFISINACLFDGAVDDVKITGDFTAVEPPATEPPATEAPTQAPTQAPTEAPTAAPTQAPTKAPTQAPTQAPTAAPTQAPTQAPATQAPTQAPTAAPTEAPTQAPSEEATAAPTEAPTVAPTEAPATEAPTQAPTQAPTDAGSQNNGNQGLPTGVIVAIVVGVILAAGAVAVVLILKKK